MSDYFNETNPLIRRKGKDIRYGTAALVAIAVFVCTSPLSAWAQAYEIPTAPAEPRWLMSGPVAGTPAEVNYALTDGVIGQIAYWSETGQSWVRLGTSFRRAGGAWQAVATSYFGPGQYGLLPWLSTVAPASVQKSTLLTGDGGARLVVAPQQGASLEIQPVPSLPAPWVPISPAYRLAVAGNAEELRLFTATPTSTTGTAALVKIGDGSWQELRTRRERDGSRIVNTPGTATVVLAAHPARAEGVASWYAYKRCLCAASRDFSKGTKLEVARADDPRRSVVVTVNDYGPEAWTGRVIDLDAVAFAKLGSKRAGLLTVTVKPR